MLLKKKKKYVLLLFSVPCLRNLQILVKSNTKADEEYLENLMKTNVVPSAPLNFFGGEDTTVPELVSRESSSLQIEGLIIFLYTTSIHGKNSFGRCDPISEYVCRC